MHVHAMNVSSQRFPVVLACLTDPSRYRALAVLLEGDFCVSEIAARIGLSQSCTTRHLQTMQRAGVLTRTRVGKRVLFRIREADPELGRLLELVALRRPLESAAPPPPRLPAREPTLKSPHWAPRARRRLAANAGGEVANAVPLAAPVQPDPITHAPEVPATPSDTTQTVVATADPVPPASADPVPPGPADPVPPATAELEDYLL